MTWHTYDNRAHQRHLTRLAFANSNWLCSLFANCQPVIYFSVNTKSTNEHCLILLVDWFDFGDLIKISEETLLTAILVSGQLYLRPPSQKPDFLNSYTNSAFFIPVSGQLQLRTPFSRPEGFRSRGRASTVFLLYLSSSSSSSSSSLTYYL